MSAPRRVLIVDDDASIRQVLEIAMAEDGYVVAAALAIIGDFAPHVILLDLRMRGMDGW